MPRLQEFVGTREYPPKPSAATSGFVMHSSNKKERMRAIIQGLASSTDPQKSKSTYGSRDDVFSGFQPDKVENIGQSSPVMELPDIPSKSLIANTRWHGNRPAVRTSHSINDPSSQDLVPMEEMSPGHDIFGTDIENLDSTVASSDVASSDFGDIQSRYEQVDHGIGVTTNPNQHLRTGQPQQRSLLLKRGYHESRDDEYVVPLDEGDYLRDKDGKDCKSIIEDKFTSPRLDGMDRLPRSSHPRVLEGNSGPLQWSPHAANIRGNSAPTITKSTPNLISSKDSTELSASIVNSGLTHRRNLTLHVSNGDLGARFLHAGEPRQEEVKESDGNKKYYIPRDSSEAELNHIRLREEKGDMLKDIPPNFRQRSSSFSSRSENIERIEDLDHSTTHLGGMIHQETREDPLEQNLDNKRTNDFQNIADSELSKGLLKLYDTRENINAHSQREDFFSALNVMQSEKCGELFIERFVDIMAKYNAVRRQRRDIATALELEIAGRESHVSARRQVLNRNLDELRQAGKGMVRGKSSILSSE